MKTRTLVSTLVILIIIIIISVIYTTVPRLELNGIQNMTLSYRDTYEEPGVILKNANTKYLNKVKIDNNIDNDKLGTYYVDYSLKIGSKTLKKRRNVKIIDDIPPVIKLEGNQIVEISINEEYKEPGYKAIDEYDGDITENVEVIGEVNPKEYGEYVIKYRVKDNNNNITEVNRIVKVIDEIPPKIICNSDYSAFKKNEENIIGCKVMDNFDGDITGKVKIIGEYNTSEPGIYKIEYKVKDDAENESTIKHNIIIYEPTENKTAYIITKDTNEIIELITKNNIKTTIITDKPETDEKIIELKENNQIGLKINNKILETPNDLKEYLNSNHIKYININKNMSEEEIERIVKEINQEKIVIFCNTDIKKELETFTQLLTEMEYKFETINNLK